jgi:hypothetical protein
VPVILIGEKVEVNISNRPSCRSIYPRNLDRFLEFGRLAFTFLYVSAQRPDLCPSKEWRKKMILYPKVRIARYNIPPLYAAHTVQ